MQPRLVDLVVSTSDWGSGVTGSSPNEGTTPTRNILEQSVYSNVLRSTKPFIPPGSINWYRLRLGVEVLSALSPATGPMAG